MRRARLGSTWCRTIFLTAASSIPSLYILDGFKKCLLMPACQRSGYALLTDKLEIMRFDHGGNDLVVKFLAMGMWRNGMKIRVDRKIDEDLLIVKRLR